MRVRFTDTAVSELEDIFRFLAQRNPRAAAAFAKRVKDMVVLLAQYPFSGREADEAGVRVASMVRYPFLVFYTVTADEVVILNVRHTARQWPWEE
jgi:plasmid stabilization system protein ParE